MLGGLIGLGGAEFPLPLLIAVFELDPQRAVRINLLVSLAMPAGLLVAETIFAGATHLALPADQLMRVPVALVAGVLIGVAAISMPIVIGRQDGWHVECAV